MTAHYSWEYTDAEKRTIIAQHVLLPATSPLPQEPSPSSSLAERLQATLNNIDAHNAQIRSNLLTTLLTGPTPARFLPKAHPDAMDLDTADPTPAVPRPNGYQPGIPRTLPDALAAALKPLNMAPPKPDLPDDELIPPPPEVARRLAAVSVIEAYDKLAQASRQHVEKALARCITVDSNVPMDANANAGSNSAATGTPMSPSLTRRMSVDTRPTPTTPVYSNWKSGEDAFAAAFAAADLSNEHRRGSANSSVGGGVGGVEASLGRTDVSRDPRRR